MVAAAKSLVNFFRDVCPNLLPKKFRGRFTKVDEDNARESLVFGRQKVSFGIDGLDLLQKAEGGEGNLATQRLLDQEDLKRLKILKLR